MIVRFFDYLEANAEDYWQVPELELAGPHLSEEDEEDLFGAAYEDVTYQDTTGDEEGAVSDGGGPVEEFDLEHGSRATGETFAFSVHACSAVADRGRARRRKIVRAGHGWEQTPGVGCERRATNRQRLLALLDAIHTHPLREPTGDYDSLVEYDRRRVLKEQLLFTTIGTCLDTVAGRQRLAGRLATGSDGRRPSRRRRAWEPFAIRLEQALFAGEAAAAR